MKAILEIEMPEDCYHCILSEQDYENDGFTPLYCGVLIGNDTDAPKEGRRCDCPLIEIKEDN